MASTNQCTLVLFFTVPLDLLCLAYGQKANLGFTHSCPSVLPQDHWPALLLLFVECNSMPGLAISARCSQTEHLPGVPLVKIENEHTNNSGQADKINSCIIAFLKQ